MRENAGKNQSAQTTVLRKDFTEQERGKGKGILANSQYCPHHESPLMEQFVSKGLNRIVSGITV